MAPVMRSSSSSSALAGGGGNSRPVAVGEGTNSSSRLVLILTALPLSLAAFAFILQFQDVYEDPRLLEEKHSLPGWQLRTEKVQVAKTDFIATKADCPKHPRNPLNTFPFQPWHASLEPLPFPKISICTTTASGLSQILPWLFYHRALGVELFILFVEGEAAKPQNAAALQSIDGVEVIFRTTALEEQQARSRIWNETWLAFFFYKPCNYELFVRQSLNMELAIVIARERKMDWILHIDTDELLYPANSFEFSLQRLLSQVPEDVDTVIFPNYETAIERDDLVDPFVEVSMFKKNFEHVARETYFAHYRDATRGNPNYFLTYGNGKSAARMRENLRPNGAHRWHNYARPPKEHKLPEAAVLHYTYAKFSDLTSRRDRCGCKPNAEDVKKCFMLDFDRSAFIIASTHTDEQMLQWYREHVVWLDPETNMKLIKKGLFGRIHTPQVIIRGIYSSGIINETIAKGIARVKEQKELGNNRAHAGKKQESSSLRRGGDGGGGGGGGGGWRTNMGTNSGETWEGGSRISLGSHDKARDESNKKGNGVNEGRHLLEASDFFAQKLEAEAEPPLPSPSASTLHQSLLFG